MSLTAQFAGHFDSAIQHRGANYFRTGRVPDVNDRHILAALAGATPVHSQTYYGYQSSLSYGGTLPYRYRLTDPQPRLMLSLLSR
jgi:hypothetical protein